jgi:hypothetical protein
MYVLYWLAGTHNYGIATSIKERTYVSIVSCTLLMLKLSSTSAVTYVASGRTQDLFHLVVYFMLVRVLCGMHPDVEQKM